MALNHYECLILLDVVKVSGNQEGARNSILAILNKHGAEVIAARPWDERKLAYPIEGQKKGHYFLTFFKLDSLKLEEVQQDLKLNEQVLRFLTQKIPPKWLDEMMAVAKEDGRYAYQAMREESEGGEGGGGGEGAPAPAGEGGFEDGERRRGPRRQMEEVGKD